MLRPEFQESHHWLGVAREEKGTQTKKQSQRLTSVVRLKRGQGAERPGAQAEH